MGDIVYKCVCPFCGKENRVKLNNETNRRFFTQLNYKDISCEHLINVKRITMVTWFYFSVLREEGQWVRGEEFFEVAKISADEELHGGDEWIGR